MFDVRKKKEFKKWKSKTPAKLVDELNKKLYDMRYQKADWDDEEENGYGYGKWRWGSAGIRRFGVLGVVATVSRRLILLLVISGVRWIRHLVLVVVVIRLGIRVRRVRARIILAVIRAVRLLRVSGRVVLMVVVMVSGGVGWTRLVFVVSRIRLGRPM